MQRYIRCPVFWAEIIGGAKPSYRSKNVSRPNAGSINRQLNHPGVIIPRASRSDGTIGFEAQGRILTVLVPSAAYPSQIKAAKSQAAKLMRQYAEV